MSTEWIEGDDPFENRTPLQPTWKQKWKQTWLVFKYSLLGFKKGDKFVKLKE